MWAEAAIFLLLVIGLLSIPITLQFALSWPATTRNDIRLGWAFGLIRVRVAPDKSKLHGSKKPAQKQRKKKPSRQVGTKANILPVLREKRVRRRAIRFARDLWAAVHKDSIQLRARIGLGDPADTGRLWAIMGPIAGLLSAVKSASIVVQPDFTNLALDIDARGRIRVIPLRVMGLFLAIPFSPAFWLAIRRTRSAG
jgi:hypothetical protein